VPVSQVLAHDDKVTPKPLHYNDITYYGTSWVITCQCVVTGLEALSPTN
jgi:hypothetical protein